MKKILLVTLMLSAPLTYAWFAPDAPKPLPESKAWKGYCECMTEDQIYFARSF